MSEHDTSADVVEDDVATTPAVDETPFPEPTAPAASLDADDDETTDADDEDVQDDEDE